MIEFPHIREIIAGYTSFSAGRELALKLEPLGDFDRLALLLGQSKEARHLLTLDAGFSIGGVTDIRERSRLAALGKVLEPRELIDIQSSLTAAGELRSRLRRFEDQCPLLWSIAEGIGDFHSLARDILGCISTAGEVQDSASPELAEIRRRLREMREQLTQRLEAIIRSPKGQKIIQEPIITEREGRCVLLVKIEARHELKGIIHDVSNTGVTVFVEPWATVELGNELREMVNREQREVDRILGNLTVEVGSYDSQISDSISRIARLDLEIAKAKYARRTRGAEAALSPLIEGQKNVLKLVQARHPLLGDKAVSLSVEIGQGFSGLVITGPNTGGKTVALKTIGLLSLMTLAGLPIPAAPDSEIPFFDGIYADIGDEQSIEQTLSTFSWHMGNIVRILSQTSPRSLVLLDELGTSTDPAEGSALARSILLEFLDRGVMSVATTHFNELKVFAHTTPGLQNASLDFDPVTLAPTYHLTVGVPGGSNAMATASRLGLPAKIIERARGMLSRGAEELEALLANLMEERRTIGAARDRLLAETVEARKTRDELEKELERVKTEARRSFQEERDRIVSEAAELNREIRQAAADLRREHTRESVDRARQALAAVRQELGKETWKSPAETAPGPERIAAGDTVRLKEANIEATVLRVLEDTQQVEVQAGPSRFRLGQEKIEKLSPLPAAAAPPAIRSPIARRPVNRELDLRGKRADEIEVLLDSYLNDASLAGLSEVRVIHGIGTGVVRKIARDFLASHPLVKSFRSGQKGEGGDGATVVSL